MLSLFCMVSYYLPFHIRLNPDELVLISFEERGTSMKKKLSAVTTGVGALLEVFAPLADNIFLFFGLGLLGQMIGHRKMICPYCKQEVSVLEIQTSHTCPHCREKIVTV